MKPPAPAHYANVYYDPSHPAGYGSVTALAAAVGGGATWETAADWLKTQDAYTLHKPARQRFRRGQIYVSGLDAQWSADLVSLIALADQNNGYRYILTVVDVLSKYAWARPLKDKGNATVVKAFKSIFAEGRQPQTLRTDRGTEFTGAGFKRFLKEVKVTPYLAEHPMKASVAERFNKTLQGRLWHYFTATNKQRYVDVLQDFMTSYNAKKHRTTGKTPLEVTAHNAEEVWQRLYGHKLKQRQRSKQKVLKQGDQVRLSKAKGQFEQGYKQAWTREIFTIARVLDTDSPRYVVQDAEGERIQGTFEYMELQGVKTTRKQVSKVVKRTATEKVVRWRGYPSTLQTWLPRL